MGAARNHLSQRGSPAVHGVNESLCDSFAHQKSNISGDVNETRSVSFASRRNGVPADSSEIFDFRDTRTRRVLGTLTNRFAIRSHTRNLRFLGTGGNRVSHFRSGIVRVDTSSWGASAIARQRVGDQSCGTGRLLSGWMGRCHPAPKSGPSKRARRSVPLRSPVSTGD